MFVFLGLESMTPEERSQIEDQVEQAVLKKLKEQIPPWRPLNYDEFGSYTYLVGRLAADYATMRAVLAEIRHQNPAFAPKSLLDFGSGIGTSFCLGYLSGFLIRRLFIFALATHEVHDLGIRDESDNRDVRIHKRKRVEVIFGSCTDDLVHGSVKVVTDLGVIRWLVKHARGEKPSTVSMPGC
ncbi:hypothetical protein HPB47_008088 [Ixodes persulcatus]|uniref:Uncharacterized protein n=1 Tax=Ixodes persulcatus TaxID=34615 RepID=A0AC60P5N2_IXOPE|nr:hypothetical protein HPB47_008088 [Ixodes persulcatus]